MPIALAYSDQKKMDELSSLQLSKTECLSHLVEEKSPLKECDGLLESIRQNIYLLRVGIQDDGDSDFDRKYFKWRCIENRYNRSKRLFELGAPSIIILNELGWLRTGVEHLNLLKQGIEPQYTEDKLEELESMAEFERSLEDEDQ